MNPNIQLNENHLSTWIMRAEIASAMASAWFWCSPAMIVRSVMIGLELKVSWDNKSWYRFTTSSSSFSFNIALNRSTIGFITASFGGDTIKAPEFIFSSSILRVLNDHFNIESLYILPIILIIFFWCLISKRRRKCETKSV